MKKINCDKYFDKLTHHIEIKPTIFANSLRELAAECEKQYGCAHKTEKELVAHFSNKLNPAYAELVTDYSDQ